MRLSPKVTFLCFGSWISLILGMSDASAQIENPASIGEEVSDFENVNPRIYDSYLFKFLRDRGLDQIPRTSSQLTEELVYSGYDPVRLLGPRGRSAQRPCTDEESPRNFWASFQAQVLADRRVPIGFEDYRTFDGSDYMGRLFFAHVPNCDQIEIISWNFTSGKFDYFVVDEASKPEAKLYEVTLREACTSCHKTGSPMWAALPAREFVSHDPALFFNTDTQPLNFAASPTLYDKEGILLTKELTPELNDGSLGYGMSVVVSNRVKQANEILRRLCVERTDCKRMVLAMALANVKQSTFIRNINLGLSDPNDLRTIDPQTVVDALDNNSVPGFFRQKYYTKLVNEMWSPNNFAITSDILADITMVAGDSNNVDFTVLDPSTPRPVAVPIPSEKGLAYLYDVAFEGLGFERRHILHLRTLNPDLITRMFVKERSKPEIDAEVDQIIKDWPPTPDQVVQLIDRWVTPSENSYRSKPWDGGTDKIALTDTSDIFQGYCAQCHKGSNPPGDFNVQDSTIDQIQVWNRDHGNIVNDVLVSGEMPPGGSPKPNRSQVQTLVNALNGQNTDAFVNHFRVRVRASNLVSNSFIRSPNDSPVQPKTSIYIDPCTGKESGKIGRQSYLAAEFGDENYSFALENFPEYMVGTIVQVIAAYDTSAANGMAGSQSCTLVGVTRNGALRYLSYDNDLKKKVSKALPVSQQNLRILHLAQPYHPAAKPDGVEVTETYALGRDKNFYQITFNFKDNASAAVTPLTLRNGAAYEWSRIAHVKNKLFYLETVDGAVLTAQLVGTELQILPRGLGAGTINGPGELDTKLQEKFTPSLLDRSSVLLIPARSRTFNAPQKYRAAIEKNITIHPSTTMMGRSKRALQIGSMVLNIERSGKYSISFQTTPTMLSTAKGLWVKDDLGFEAEYSGVDFTLALDLIDGDTTLAKLRPATITLETKAKSYLAEGKIENFNPSNFFSRDTGAIKIDRSQSQANWTPRN